MAHVKKAVVFPGGPRRRKRPARGSRPGLIERARVLRTKLGEDNLALLRFEITSSSPFGGESELSLWLP